MEELKSLIKIVNKQKTKSLGLFAEDLNNTSKIRALYDGIASGTIKNDRNAIETIYQSSNSLQAFKKLKLRLRKRLLNAIFFIDINKPSFTDYKKAKFELHREWAATRLLIDRGDRVVSLSLLQHSIILALKFEFTDIAVLCLRDLVKHFSIVNPNAKKASYYQSLLEQKTQLLSEELKIEKYYNKLSLLSITDKSPDQSKLIKSIENIEEELEYIFNNHKSLLVTVHYFYILSEKYLIKKQFKKCVELCNLSLQYFNTLKFKNKIVEGQINNTLILSFLSLNEYKKAISLIDKNLQIFPQRSYSWYKVLSHKSNAHLLLKDYNVAIELVHSVLNTKQLVNFGHYFELFQLKEAYLDLLVRSNRIMKPENANYRKFKLAKFLNNVPSFSKDKRGLNVAILIIGLLHLLRTNRFDKVLKRLDALKQYSYRYLRNDHTLRSNCFIKMLCKIPNANYHPIAFKRHTKKLYDKLSSTSYMYSENPSEIEVIPYEDLWDIVLNILDKNKKQTNPN